VTEKRGSFKAWTVLLAIFAFSLSLLGTFLVRSGVLTSVHAFATDPKRGIFILAFLAIVVSVSLVLFAWRAPRVGLGGRFELISRESMLLANNMVLSVAAAAVMLGTLYPLVLDALGLGKISVGPPYFETVFVPLMTPALFLMGVGPLARWREAKVPDLALRLKWALAVSVATALLLPAALGEWSAMKSLGLLLSFWVFASVAQTLIELLWPKSRAGLVSGLWSRWRAIPRAQLGMLVAHAGIGMFVLGVTMVKSYEVERDLKMDPGDTTTIAGYVFRFDGTRDVRGPNYTAARGAITVTRDGKLVAAMHPEKRVYAVQNQPMTEAAIDSWPTRDLYVSLGEPATGGTPGAWIVRVYYKPFVSWIWWGCLVMAIGGVLAASDRRYRVALRRREEVAVKDEAARGAALTGAARR